MQDLDAQHFHFRWAYAAAVFGVVALAIAMLTVFGGPFLAQPTVGQTIGAIAVDPFDTRRVLAGCGEGFVAWQGAAAFGKGIYRSGDAGGNWELISSTWTTVTIFSNCLRTCSSTLSATRSVHPARSASAMASLGRASSTIVRSPASVCRTSWA